MSKNNNEVWCGADALKHMIVPIKALKYDPHNIRRHDERGLAAVKASLDRYGQQKPVVFHGDGVVKAGNLTLRSATELGWTHIAASRFDGSLKEATGYAAADNRAAEHSFFDADSIKQITELLADGFSADDLGGWLPDDLATTGFDVDELIDDDPVDDGEDDQTGGSKSIRITEDQWEVVSDAIEKVREITGKKMSEGTCIEFLCADFLGG
tara:strand:- start:1431 stop:2063 length:633 start_codon:yes stop_codon:yes gene_type:complete